MILEILRWLSFCWLVAVCYAFNKEWLWPRLVTKFTRRKA